MGNGGSARAPLLPTSGGTSSGDNCSACAADTSGFASVDEDGNVVCAICISPLHRAQTFCLPACNHVFHGLCVASALQVSPLCPICRVPVDEQTISQVAKQIASDASQAGSLLAAEIVMELRTKGKTGSRETKVTPEETADAIRLAARKGDTSKIPAIAALLGRSRLKDAAGNPPQPPLVRLAALDALRELVPTFPREWPGLGDVQDLLQRTVVQDTNNEVRCKAANAIKDVCLRGDKAALNALGNVLLDNRATPELRLHAADAVRALAVPSDEESLKTAMVALRDRDFSVQSAGFGTLKTICPARGKSPALVKDLASIVAEHQDPQVRASALELIGQAEAVGSEAEAVGSMFGIRTAVAALHDQEEQVASAALAALRRLWERGDEQALGTLATLVAPGNSQSPHPMVRCMALETLRSIAQPGNNVALRAAAMALDDADGSVQGAGVQALKHLCVRGDREVTSVLVQYLAHPDSEVRRLTIEVLGYATSPNDAEVVSTLRRLTAGPDPDMQMAAEQALRQIR